MQIENLVFHKVVDYAKKRHSFHVMRNGAIALGMAAVIGLTGCGKEEVKEVPAEIEMHYEKEPEVFSVTSEQMSELGIILNDEGEASLFVEQAADYLQEHHVSAMIAHGSEQDLKEKIEDAKLQFGKATVISIDGTSYKGDRLLITAPYQNGLENSSDVLAMAANSVVPGATDGLRCGISNSGTLTGRTFSKTELACGADVGFVVLNLGKTTTSETVNRIVFGALQKTTVLSQLDQTPDLLYSVEVGDTYGRLQNKFAKSEFDRRQMSNNNRNINSLQAGDVFYLPANDSIQEILSGEGNIHFIGIESDTKGSSK